MELAFAAFLLAASALLFVYSLVSICTISAYYTAGRIARENTMLCTIPTQLRQLRLLPASTEEKAP